MSDSTAYCGSTLEAELAECGVYLTSTIGYSMAPLFSHRRDAVLISVPTGAIKKYDVILYPGTPGTYVLHRVIAVRDDYYITRGDNTYFKERVPKDKVLGVLVSFTRKGKKSTVDTFGYRLYSRLWCAIYPVRLCLRKARRALSRIYRAIFKRGKRK